MIGSPNFVRFVSDGDNSTFPPGTGVQAGPPGSGSFVTTTSPAHPGGIPVGGLFTGASGIKTPEQAATYGGMARERYDACYHLACETYSNISTTVLDQISDAAAHATSGAPTSCSSSSPLPARYSASSR